MDDFIIVPILAIALLWLAAVAYMIYKDHGVVEQIDVASYRDELRPSKAGNKLDLKNRIRKRFQK